MSVLFAITLVALVGMIVWNLIPKGKWGTPIHLVLQSAKQPHDDKQKFEHALQNLDPHTYNVKWNKIQIPAATPVGSPSADTDHGANDDSHHNSHVTEQVSFQTAAALSQFLTDSGL